ncbi:gp16 family protein [Grimontia hollisae]|uniref:gp16 family protein n=1 Tax=Grimontia hollisae TaxID=673 RepID=UPI0012ACE0C4|nr:regulatory protein GemA [Grimontia hollisae]
MSDNRKRLIQLIHVGKRELQLDDDTYRALLSRETGKASCSTMKIAELDKVLAAMERQGFKRQKKGKAVASGKRYSPKSKGYRTEVHKIRAIWITMAKQGFVRDGSETALDAYVRRMTSRSKGKGVDAVAWLKDDQAYMVLESLKRWHRREAIEALKAKGWSVPYNDKGTDYAGYELIIAAFELMQRTLEAQHDSR